MSYSDNQRRRLIASYAKPTPRKPGYYLDLRIFGYASDDHSGLAATDSAIGPQRDKRAVIHGVDDLMTAAEVLKLLRTLRQRLNRRARNGSR
jgi:hypothetical protein